MRQLSRWWVPKNEAIRRARISRGKYKCELCGAIGPASLPPLEGKKRKRHNIQGDHIIPVIGEEGFVSYDEWIERCFVPASGFQAICYACHSSITQKENKERKEYLLKEQ